MEKSSFFNAKSVGGEWDRTYTAEDFANYFGTVLTNGVFPSPSTNLQVVANNDMTVNIKQGSAFINGYMYHNTEDLTLNVDVADGVLKRIDLVVVRLDHNNREIKCHVKKGNASSKPVTPSLTRDEFTYELCIAELHVEKGITVISQANIVDTRMSNVQCGIVSSLIEVDTQEIYSQLRTLCENKENEFNKWFADLQTNLSGDIAANLQNQINEIENELIVTNNSNYVTSNQSKVFTSKSSYATDFKLLGNTKILNANDEECNAWDSGARLVSVGGDYLSSNGIYINISSGIYKNNVLLNYKLKGVRTVKDEIITENGDDYLIHRLGEILINGSEVITGPTQINAKTMRFDIKLDGLLSNNKGNIIATRFSVGNAYDANIDYECITNYDSNTLCVKIENVRLSTWNVEVFKKWLRANPIRVIYERNAPIKTKIPKINLNTYTGENTLSINTGPVKTECEFNVTNNLSSSLSVMSTGLKSALDVSRDFNNYVNRRTDGVIQNKNICYLNELNSGFYSIKECTGFPYGWGQILLTKHDLISYSIIYFNYEIDMDISGMYINTCQAGKYTGWRKISTVSTYAIESRLQNVEQENADLTFTLMEKGVI